MRPTNGSFERIPAAARKGYPTHFSMEPDDNEISEYGALRFDDSALDANGGGVGPIVGSQLGQNVFDASLHRLFGNR